MTPIQHILSETSHRSFEVPQGRWAYYQEWNEALFLHWQIPLDLLRPLVPGKLHIDTFNGAAFISLVAFTMQKIRPRNLPAIRYISDFNEINLRTYIDNSNRKGVYFLNIEGAKHLSVFIAKALSGLPYEKSKMHRTSSHYKSTNKRKDFFLDTAFDIRELVVTKTELDKWLTERYCLYLDRKEKLYRYDIHHREWEIKNVDINRLHVNYKIGGLALTDKPDRVHYSKGVQVVAWRKKRVE